MLTLQRERQSSVPRLQSRGSTSKPGESAGEGTVRIEYAILGRARPVRDATQ